MKKTNFKSLFYLAISSLAFTGALTSCSVDEFISNKDLVEKLEKFHFNTSEEVTIDIDYGPLASRALVEVYGENPLADATPENDGPKGNTVFTTFLDQNGQYHGTMNVPAHVKDLYFYSSSMATPLVRYAKRNGDEVKISESISTPKATRTTRTVNDDQLVVRQLTSTNELSNTNYKNFYTIVGGWDNYGNPEDPNQLIDEGHLMADDVLSIEHYFWGGRSAKPSPMPEDLKNLHKGMRVDNVNMVVQEHYEEDGQTYNVEHAEVWFTFLTEYAWNENTVGYYFFNKDNPPQTVNDIKQKFIILPNASMPIHPPYQKEAGDIHYKPTTAPVELNKRIQLLYVDEKGKASKYFPPNIEIGFFVMANGFRGGSYTGPTETIDGFTYNTRKAGIINPEAKTYYSDYRLNGSTNDDKRFVACRLANNTVVYGAEDGSDWSYDDMMFTITATPEKAIHTQEGSTLTPIPGQKVPRTYTDNSESCTYAFEDIWPDGGDYDLNDVVVRHNRTIKKDQFNMVSKVVDNFILEVNSSTSFCNAFAMQTSHHGDRCELPAGAWYEEETGSFFLAHDVRDVRNQKLTITREFDSPVTFATIQNEFNPFIVNQTKGVDCNTSGRIEIHLPGGEVTSMGMRIDNTKNPTKSWYISDDGKYPYALKIPGTVFVPCPERVRIGSETGAYPNFNKWVNSDGKNYTDWYKNK